MCAFASIWIYRGGECQDAWFSKFRSRPCQSRRWAHNCQSLTKSGEKRQECTHKPADAGCIILYGGAPQHVYTHSVRQLWASQAYVSPRLSKPASFIILQQPCSNWAASPPAVTHHLLHIEPEEIQMYLVRHSPVAAHQPLHLNCICGQLSPSSCTELFPLLAVGTCLSLYSQWCGSLVMMWPISLTGDWATTLRGWKHHSRDLCPPICQWS